jgi:hypothetical protein
MTTRVCVPFYGEFEAAKPGLRELKAHPGRYAIEARQGTYIWMVRNSLVNDEASSRKRQIPLPYDAWLFVDSDIAFSLEDVEHLEALNRPIVCLPYRTHDAPDRYQAGRLDGRGMIVEKYPATTTGLQTVDFCGAGFLRIRRDVFCTLEYPWFRHQTVELELEGVEYCEIMGEDIGFCMAARAAGYDIWCDFDRPVTHRLRTARQFDWQI